MGWGDSLRFERAVAVPCFVDNNHAITLAEPGIDLDFDGERFNALNGSRTYLGQHRADCCGERLARQGKGRPAVFRNGSQ